MRLVVADTGPLHYLVQTGDIALLPGLFAKVLTPARVRDELAHARAPEAVRAWIAAPPPWLEIRPVENECGADDLAALDAGERDAIALALATKADPLLMDDREGVAAARRRGFAVTGTLGLLDLAARRGLVDLAAAFARLRRRASITARVFSTRCWRNMRRRSRECVSFLPVIGRRRQALFSRFLLLVESHVLERWPLERHARALGLTGQTPTAATSAARSKRRFRSTLRG